MHPHRSLNNQLLKISPSALTEAARLRRFLAMMIRCNRMRNSNRIPPTHPFLFTVVVLNENLGYTKKRGGYPPPHLLIECYIIILSSASPFSFCLQSFSASRSFQMYWISSVLFVAVIYFLFCRFWVGKKAN